MTDRPSETEYAPYYGKYVSLVTEPEILPALAAQATTLKRVAACVQAEREQFCYALGKWSIREVFGHLGDGERVFGYRAAGISRGDQTRFPSFDENVYVTQGRFGDAPLVTLLDELLHLRAANLIALERLVPAAWQLIGTASERPVSVRALAFIMVGHVRHHLEILHERYGVPRV